MAISFGYYHYNNIKGINKVENEKKLIEKESSINKSDDNL
jgi:hypothetical protein